MSIRNFFKRRWCAYCAIAVLATGGLLFLYISADIRAANAHDDWLHSVFEEIRPGMSRSDVLEQMHRIGYRKAEESDSNSSRNYILFYTPYQLNIVGIFYSRLGLLYLVRVYFDDQGTVVDVSK